MAYRLCAFADEADSRLTGQIAALRRNGVSQLEIRGVDAANISQLSPQQVREVRRQLDDAGITVWSIGSPTGKIKLRDDFAPHFDQYRRMLDSAVTLGATRFRLFSFYEAYDRPDEVLERLRRMCEAADGSGVRLCHENEKDIFGDTAIRCRYLLDALPELYAVFDPANFIQVGQDTREAWELLRDRVDYLHIKDARPNGTVVPAGAGVGRVGEIAADFLSRGGRVLTVEPHLADFCGLSGLEQGQQTKDGFSEFHFADNNEAFDAAVSALRQLLAAHTEE